MLRFWMLHYVYYFNTHSNRRQPKNLLQIGFRKFKSNFLSSQPLVDSSKSLNFVFNVGLLILVQMNLDQACGIKPDTNSLANDLSREYQVFKNSIMHRCQSTARRNKKSSSRRRNNYEYHNNAYLKGRFCLMRNLVLRVGLGRILLWAMKTTCLPENFFSSSRTRRVWIFWKALN